MKRSGWMAGAKVLAATAALACVAAMASTAAQADLYNYTYLVTQGINSNISGTFNATITGIGTQISTSGPVTINNGSGNALGFSSPGAGGIMAQPVTGIDGTLNINAGFGNFSALITTSNRSGGDGVVGLVSGTSTSFSFGTASSGLFSAVYSGPSGGGGGGGGGGGSGGAPTPEVNAGLGILIAGASFAFLRRKRGTGHEATAA